MIALTKFAGLTLLAAAVTAGPTVRTPPSPEAGTLQGTVRFEGTPPAAMAVDMSNDAYCARVTAAAPVMRRRVEAGAGGGLGGVVVHVRTRVLNAPAAPPAEPILLDQKNCMYSPAVVALRVGQTLVVRNSDETMHNVHVTARSNRSFNLGQPRQGLESRRTFTVSEVGITVSCDVHGWMAGTIAVFDHPYFAVTDADGNFTIDGLPAGEYDIEAWHPMLGVQSARVTVAETGTSRATFSYRNS